MRLGRLAAQSIERNLYLSTATIIMIGLILFIFNVILALNSLTVSSISELNKKVDLIIYLDDKASVYDITEMMNEIKTLDFVTGTVYTSKEDALNNFLSTYPEKENPFSTYDIENPLPQSIEVSTVDPSQHDVVLALIEDGPYGHLLAGTESMSENQEIIARLTGLTTFTRKLLVGVILTFVFGSILMIMNAIHLSIFTRKTEIQIMQLVGANPGMVYGPFLVEGIIYSISAVIVGAFLLLFFLQGTGLTSYLSPETFNPFKIFGLELLSGITVGVLASYAAVKFYLRKTLMLEN